MKEMNRQRRVYQICAWVVALLSVALIGSSTTLAEGGNIGGRPALPRKDEPRSESIFIHTIKPDQTIPDAVVVSNNSSKTQDVDVYAVDAIPTNTGAFTCKQRAESVTDAGKWIKLDKQTVTLKPDQSRIVDFTITAPSNADVGEHNACIVLEQANDNSQISGNLIIRTRSAIRVALTIPGELHRKVAIDAFKVTQDSNSGQTYDVILKNTGNVSADANVKVDLSNLAGRMSIYSNGGQYPVLAGDKLELSYSNDKLPFFGGWYRATVSVSYNKDAGSWSTHDPKQLATVRMAPVVVFITPQPGALVIMIVVLLVVIWLVWFILTEKRRRDRMINLWKPHKVKEGETIQSLAERTGVRWKKIAKLNRLKAPYVLEEGKVIYLPKKRQQIKKKTINVKG